MKDTRIKELLKELCAADGVSGAEESICELIKEKASRYGKTEIDDFGNVVCTVDGFDERKKTLMLCAHIDEIGLIINYITDDGFLKASACGGIDLRVLPASRVTVLAGDKRIKGVITSVPPHLQAAPEKCAPLDELYIDIGFDGQKAKQLVSLGDRALIENELIGIGRLVSSKALDDRFGAAAVLTCLETLKGKETAYNVKAVFSSKEETGSAGAKTAAFREKADIAIAVDVTFGRSHGESERETGAVGGGPMIGVSPILSRPLSNALINIAEEENIPYGIEVMGSRTGTDADHISVARGGCITAAVSLPIRYMHTPAETADIEDLKNTAALTARFAERGEL